MNYSSSVECYPTYNGTSPVCTSDTTGRCIDSGLMNVEGFPPCCNPDVPESCIISSSNPYVPKNAVSKKPVTTTDNLSGAAAGCVAKNPNYPAPVGGCVYNGDNPCPTKYETTDTRFGTKMCCAPQDTTNTACFAPVSDKSTFGNKGILKKNSKYRSQKKNKSTFGSTTSNIWIFLVIAALLIYFLFFNKRVAQQAFGRFNFGKR